MANEINSSVTLSVNKNGASISRSKSKALTQSGTDSYYATPSVATTAAQISFGAITGAPVTVYLANLDATNFINYGPSNPPTEFKLGPGQVALFQPAAATQYWKADTAAVQVEILAVEA
jgi:hypothetical protein